MPTWASSASSSRGEPRTLQDGTIWRRHSRTCTDGFRSLQTRGSSGSLDCWANAGRTTTAASHQHQKPFLTCRYRTTTGHSHSHSTRPYCTEQQVGLAAVTNGPMIVGLVVPRSSAPVVHPWSPRRGVGRGERAGGAGRRVSRRAHRRHTCWHARPRPPRQRSVKSSMPEVAELRTTKRMVICGR
jgi:hypothetical protein